MVKRNSKIESEESNRKQFMAIMSELVLAAVMIIAALLFINWTVDKLELGLLVKILTGVWASVSAFQIVYGEILT